jgi:hypothetical protein
MKKCTEWKASRICGTYAKSWTRLKNRGRSLWSLHSVAHRRARTRNFWLLKYGCALLPFLFSWFYPLWFLRVYESEVAALRMSLKFRNNRWQSYTRYWKVSSSCPTVAESLEPSQELCRVQRTITKARLYFVRLSPETFVCGPVLNVNAVVFLFLMSRK